MKRLLSFAMMALLLLTASAQRQYSPEFWIGAHGGATFSRQSFVPSSPQSFLPGAMIGVTAKYTEERYFGLIAEINIQQRGWKENFEKNPFSYSRTLTYIQIPLMTHIFFGNDRIHGFFNAGPEVAYMIASKTSADFDYMNYRDVPGFPLRNRVNEQLSMKISNRFDYGISASVGMELFMGRRNSLQLEGRFYYGIANIFPAEAKDTFGASRGYSIEVLLGYRFRLR